MRVLALLCTLFLGSAFAKPLHSNAAAIRAKTRVLVSGTLVENALGGAFEVHDVLWDPDGLMTAGQVVIEGPNGGFDVGAGQSAVLFLDRHRTPVFAAQPKRPVPAAELGRHPLHIRGFYVFNAHLTTPAVASLAGLVRGLKTDRFEERLRVDVTFGGTDAAFTLDGRMVDGVVKTLTGEHATTGARIVPWDYQVLVTLAGKHSMTLGGAFEAVDGGVLHARVVPDAPYVPDEAALGRWLRTGEAEVPLTLIRGDASAVLMLTGQTRGALGPGLGVEGQLASVIRQTKMGHRSQSGRLSAGKPPGNGWHVEIRTPKGPLWITLPIDVVDAGPRPPLREVVHPQTHVVLAARRGAVPVRFSGALTGSGTLTVR